MTILTLPRYLLGSRRAILEVAESRLAIVCGALFVLSAGFAREYDGEDLLHEPWHVLRPLAASLASGTVLFLLIHGVAKGRREPEATLPPVGQAYRAFLALFWMTAPLAWLYAVPYERFMSPIDAVEVNLWTLALVSVWRVVLISRAISVVYGVGVGAAFLLVMLFADVVAFIAVVAAPTPVLDVMGGIRHSARDALVADATLLVGGLAVCTMPVWLIGASIGSWYFRPNWQAAPDAGVRRTPWGMLTIAVVSVLAWAPALAVTQPEQMRRREAEALLRGGNIAEALATMSEHEVTDYPPHWNPPPQRGRFDRSPELSAVREAIRSGTYAPWVVEVYVGKTERQLRAGLRYFNVRDEDWPVAVERLEEMDELHTIKPGAAEAAEFLMQFDAFLTDADREALTRLVQAARANDEGDDESPAPADNAAAPHAAP